MGSIQAVGKGQARVSAVCAVANDPKMMKTLFVPKGNGNEHLRDLWDLLIAGSTWKNGRHHGILKIVVRPHHFSTVLDDFFFGSTRQIKHPIFTGQGAGQLSHTLGMTYAIA